MSVWTVIPDWQPLDPITAFKMNAMKENINWVKERPQDYGHSSAVANVALTSTSFIEIDSTLLSRSLTTSGGNVLFGCHIPYISHSAASGVANFDLLIDGVTYLSSLAGTPKTYGFAYLLAASAADAYPVNYVWVVPNTVLDAGTHTFALVGKVVSGTLTIALIASDWSAQSWALEI